MTRYEAIEFDLRQDKGRVILVSIPGGVRLAFWGDDGTGQVTLVLTHAQAEHLRSEIEQELRPSEPIPATAPW